MSIEFLVDPQYSLSSLIRSHGWIQLAPYSTNDSYSELTYTDRLRTGKVVELRITQSDHRITIEYDVPLNAEEGLEVRNHVNWMLCLDQDLSNFYALAAGEPKLASMIELGKGHVLRSPTLFEDVVKTILTTNTAWGGTIRMNQNLVDQFGDASPVNPSLHAFPTPEKISQCDREIFLSSVRLGYRGPYIFELAQKVTSGELDLEGLKSSESTVELRKRLLEIKGVGVYAAANLLILLGRYDYLPIDSWAYKVVSHEWYHDQPIGRREVDEAFARWGEWKGLAYWCWEWQE